MKKSNEKKIDTLKVFKVIMFVYSCAMVLLILETIYGWVTGYSDNNYAALAACTATYCASAAAYEELKKKEAKKKKEIAAA